MLSTVATKATKPLLLRAAATAATRHAPALQTVRGISASRTLQFASPFDDGNSRLQETPVNIVRHSCVL